MPRLLSKRIVFDVKKSTHALFGKYTICNQQFQIYVIKALKQGRNDLLVDDELGAL